VLNTTVDLQDKLLPGLKLTLDATYKPETNAFAGKKSMRCKNVYFKGGGGGLSHEVDFAFDDLHCQF
jgi:hypothetical protein